MTRLVSRENPRFKTLKRLASSPAARRAAGQTLLEGVHLCAAYRESGALPRQCLVGDAALGDAEVTALIAGLPASSVLVMADALFASISQLGPALAVAFLIDLPVPPEVGVLDHSAVLMDRIQDPGNLGSIMRSAAAAGIAAIYCGVGTAQVWSPKVLRAAMGAHFRLSVAEECDLASLVQAARVPVLAANAHALTSLYETDLKGPTAWVFGNEGQGISPALATLARPVAIPQPGGMDSLNVAAAAAICLFEQVRQRG